MRTFLLVPHIDAEHLGQRRDDVLFYHAVVEVVCESASVN
jgi:hypothetical protein